MPRLVSEAVSGATPCGPFRTAALDHEVIDDPVKREPVVEPLAGKEDEVVDRLGRARGVEGDDDVATVGGDGRDVAMSRVDDLLGGGVFLGHRGSLPGVPG